MQKNCSIKKDSSPIHLFLVGASGKMGKAISAYALAHTQYKIIGGCGSGSGCGESINSADVMIDFSSPKGTEIALAAAMEYKIPIVIGTTGLSPDCEKKIKLSASAIPILYSPNFSFGMAFCLKILPEFVKILKENGTCQIIETHHVHKKDAPSGTAKRLANALHPEGKIPIESIREGEAIGEHRIFFKLEGEVIELRHEALSRDAFVKGALLAANFLVNKPAGLYTLMDLIR